MICRLCLNDLEIRDSFALFDSEGNENESQLIKLIEKYLELNITSNDEISTGICNDCHNHLIEFHKFSAHISEQQKVLNQRTPVSVGNKVKPPDCVDFKEIQIKCESGDDKDGQNSLQITMGEPLKCEHDEVSSANMDFKSNALSNQSSSLSISESSRTAAIAGNASRIKVIVKDSPRKRLRHSQRRKLRRLMLTGVPYNAALGRVLEELPSNEKDISEKCKNEFGADSVSVVHAKNSLLSMETLEPPSE